MNSWILVALTTAPSLAVGIAVGVLFERRGREDEAWISDGLSEVDRIQLEAEFAMHASAVAEQLSEYGDVLAEGDPLLRARLRQIEANLRRADR